MAETSGHHCANFKLMAGRTIVCADSNKELFSITREGFSPTEADAMAYYIVDVLNRGKDFRKFYHNYMKPSPDDMAPYLVPIRIRKE